MPSSGRTCLKPTKVTGLHLQISLPSVHSVNMWINNVKVKQSLHVPEQALRVPGGWDSTVSRHSAHEGGNVISATHCPPLTPRKYSWYSFLLGGCGSTVVKVLCYKLEGRWFNPRWCHWNFYWHKSLPITLWSWGRLSLQQKWAPGAFPGGKGDRCVRLTTLPQSWNVVM